MSIDMSVKSEGHLIKAVLLLPFKPELPNELSVLAPKAQGFKAQGLTKSESKVQGRIIGKEADKML